MKRFKFILFFALAIFTLNSCSSTKSINDQLQGVWISTEDSNYQVEFKNNKWIDSYEGEESRTMTFIQGDECAMFEKGNSLSDGKYISIFLDDEVFCYFISKIDENNLELEFYGIGSILVFTKKQ